MSRRRQRKAGKDDEIVGPAKLHAGHSRRMLGTGASAKKAWRNDAEHPLTLAYAKGQLIRGNEKHTAMQRYEAGDAYRAACETSQHKTRDSTDMNVVSGGKKEGVIEGMLDAFAWLRAVDSGLGDEDRRIVRLVCGEGWFPSDAVRAAFGHDHYKYAVVPRFNEALDHLIEAIEKARSLGVGRRNFNGRAYG